jgi:hypothetical protein
MVPVCAEGWNIPALAHLEGSVRGPTGERDSSSGEVPLSVICCTSASKLRESFLSRPASLPTAPAPAAAEEAPAGTSREVEVGV